MYTHTEYMLLLQLWGGGLIAAFQYLKGAYKKDGERLFIRACHDRTKGNGFRLKENRFTLDIRMKSFTLEEVSQRNCSCPIPGSVKSQVGWGFEQPGVVKDVPAHGRGLD